MPLTRATVTVASRIMLPAYCLLCAAFGLVYTFDPGHRLNTVPALTFQRQVMGGTMLPWGLLFLGLAVLMVLAFTRKSRMTFAFALCCCAVTWLLWGGMYAVSVAQEPRASVLAPVLPLFVVAACIASTASLLKGEV